MMALQSIRYRLTVWYALALTTGLSLFAAGIWFSMGQSLKRDIDRSLNERMLSIQLFLQAELKEQAHDVREELQEYAQALPGNTYLRVTAPDGSTVFVSKADLPWPSPTGQRVADLRTPGHSYRTLARELNLQTGKWHVTFATALDDVDSLLGKLRVLLLALSPVVVLLASLGGAWLSRRALRPVDDITAAARQIGINNLSERLSVPKTGDELQRLSETWNSMLGRLEDAVSRLSRFTADASHELRTPLTVIRSTAEIASRKFRPAETYREALRQIVGESERMTGLIEDLLFLARCDAENLDLPMDALPLSALIDEAYSVMRPAADLKDIQLLVDRGEAPTLVLGNKPALRRLAIVLIDNAIKYSPCGSIVTLTLSTAVGRVHLKVRDTGAGIPEGELPFLFQRFYRGSKARENGNSGSGLGLALANGIALRHGSSITVTSTVGEGSTFEVVFAALASQA